MQPTPHDRMIRKPVEFDSRGGCPDSGTIAPKIRREGYARGCKGVPADSGGKPAGEKRISEGRGL